MNSDTKNNAPATEANPPQPPTNEEILLLLRKLVEQTPTGKSNVSYKTDPNHGDAQDNPATETADVDNDEVFDDDDDNGEIIADPDSDLETVGYIIGGAALVGLGALLYHWLKD